MRLPWELVVSKRRKTASVRASGQTDRECDVCVTDAAYGAFIVHTANAYPRLVEALRKTMSAYRNSAYFGVHNNACHDAARDLLLELGEAKEMAP